MLALSKQPFTNAPDLVFFHAMFTFWELGALFNIFLLWNVFKYNFRIFLCAFKSTLLKQYNRGPENTVVASEAMGCLHSYIWPLNTVQFLKWALLCTPLNNIDSVRHSLSYTSVVLHNLLCFFFMTRNSSQWCTLISISYCCSVMAGLRVSELFHSSCTSWGNLYSTCCALWGASSGLVMWF